jgi:hypothetical protein
MREENGTDEVQFGFGWFGSVLSCFEAFAIVLN